MISNSFTVFESLKVVLMTMLAIFMMPVKLATVGLPQINIFWNRGFDLTTSVYGVTNEILSLYLNYIVDVATAVVLIKNHALLLVPYGKVLELCFLKCI